MTVTADDVRNYNVNHDATKAREFYDPVITGTEAEFYGNNAFAHFRREPPSWVTLDEWAKITDNNFQTGNQQRVFAWTASVFWYVLAHGVPRKMPREAPEFSAYITKYAPALIVRKTAPLPSTGEGAAAPTTTTSSSGAWTFAIIAVVAAAAVDAFYFRKFLRRRG